jgi:hypothetical protein
MIHSKQDTDLEKLREFMIVLRQALLVIVRWIEKNYIDPSN